MSKIAAVLLAAVSVQLWACKQTDSGASKPAEAAQPQAVPSPVRQYSLEAVLQDTGQIEAWRKFTAGGRYRCARPADFPELQKSQDPDIAQEIETPFKAGGVTQLGSVNDFALIVVDTTVPDVNRYGLVIFYEANGGWHRQYTPHWLMRNKDLSLTVLSWCSSGLVVTTLNGFKAGVTRGKESACFVSWDRRTQRYVCR